MLSLDQELREIQRLVSSIQELLAEARWTKRGTRQACRE